MRNMVAHGGGRLGKEYLSDKTNMIVSSDLTIAAAFSRAYMSLTLILRCGDAACVVPPQYQRSPFSLQFQHPSLTPSVRALFTTICFHFYLYRRSGPLGASPGQSLRVRRFCAKTTCSCCAHMVITPTSNIGATMPQYQDPHIRRKGGVSGEHITVKVLCHSVTSLNPPSSSIS
jgi:hypothetical protein